MPVPLETGSIIVLLEGAQGEAVNGVSSSGNFATEFGGTRNLSAAFEVNTGSLDFVANDRPQSIMFQDLDPNLGAVQGRALRPGSL